MAFDDDIAPQTQSVQLFLGIKQKMNIVVKDSTGAAYDVSGWDSFEFRMTAPGKPYNNTTTQTIPINAFEQSLTGLLLEFAAGDVGINTLLPGSATFVLVGKPTSGDGNQLVARGQMSLILAV